MLLTDDAILPLSINLAKLTLFSLMFSLGITLRLEQVLWLWQRPGLLNRFILVIIVVVPTLVALVTFSSQLPREIEVGLVLTAIAPGTSLALYLPKDSRAPSFLLALQATVSLLAVATVPLTIAILQGFFPPEAHISPLDLGLQLTVAQCLPLMLGIAVRYCWAALADNLETLLGQAANILLCLLMAWVLAQQLDSVLRIGLLPLGVMGLLALGSLWIGHWLGGSDSANRITLATTATTHSAALALFIAILNLPDLGVLPAIAVYVLVSGALAIAYQTWQGVVRLP